MGSIAIGLVLRTAAAAERDGYDAIDGAARAGQNFYIAFYAQRSVRIGRDGQWAAPRGQELAGLRNRLPCRHKSRRDMRSIAKRLVLGRAATAKRRPRPDRLAADLYRRVNRERAVLAQRDRIDMRRRLADPAVVALNLNGARRAIDRHSHQRVRISRVGVDPWSLDIRLEHTWLRQNTTA